jgi:ABC-type dipeptide/oligopeptide/nickel transport system permease subunit
LVEILLSFPGLILAMALAMALGASMWTVIIAIGITRLAPSARVIRSVVLSIKETPYVDAARAVGANPLRVMVSHVAPQCVAPFLIVFTASLGGAIVTEASLSFLGVGIPPPAPTWGTMLAEASGVLLPRWFLVVFPGMFITVTVLAFNLFGDGLRDALDPRLRGST